MKKLWLVILTVLMSMSFGLAISACGAPTQESSEPETPAHEHTLSSDYSFDNDYHWKTCSGCTELVGKAHHELGEEEEIETLKGGETCVYELKYIAECGVCHQKVVVDTHEVEKHEYELTEITEATCQKAGKKIYTCKHCDSFYEEEFENSDAHVYREGETVNGITTYTCIYCDHSYSVIDAKSQTTASASADEIAEVGAIELKTATIALDQDVIDNITEGSANISISAEEKAAEELDIPEAVKQQIGDKPVYDFSLKADDEPVSELGGKVKITIPYELGENEDPDCIAIWYLNGEEVESIEAVYSNGFVTFETTHFSYYTVVRLSREDTCKTYGHNYVISSSRPATCVDDGRIVYVCRRCGEKTTDIVPATGEHEYEITENVPSTTTVAGHKKEVCVHCGDEKITYYPLEKEARADFAEQLITDILNNPLKVETTANNASVFKMYILMNELGNRYPVSVSDSYVSVVDIDGTEYEMELNKKGEGITYRIYEPDEDSSMSVDAAFAMAKQVMSCLPEGLLDTLWNAIKNNAMTVATENDYLVINLDLGKVVATYRSIINNPIKDSIDMLFGAGTFDQMMGFVELALTEDIPTIIETLKTEYGFDTDTIMSMVFGMLGAPEDMDLETMLAYMMGGMPSGGGDAMEEGGAATEGAEGEEKPSIKILDLLPMIKFMMSMMLPEGMFPQIPDDITAETIIAKINEYASKSVAELAKIPAVPEDFSVQALFDMLNAYTLSKTKSEYATLVNSVSLSIRATEFGDFISATVNVDTTRAGVNGTYVINMTQEVGDDISAEAIISNISEKVSYFPEIDETNYNNFVQDLIDKYGFTFTYTEQDDRVVLVSDKQTFTQKELTYGCYLEVMIADSWSNTVNRVQDYSSYLAKYYRRSVQCYMQDGDSDVYYPSWEEGYNDIYLLYNTETHKYRVNNGSLNTGHFYFAVNEITKEEYLKVNPTFTEYSMLSKESEAYGFRTVYKYYKGRCAFCGETEYFARGFRYYGDAMVDDGHIVDCSLTFPFADSMGANSSLNLVFGENNMGDYTFIYQSHSAEQDYDLRSYLSGYSYNITEAAFSRYRWDNESGEKAYDFGDVKIIIWNCYYDENYCSGEYSVQIGAYTYKYYYNDCFNHDYVVREKTEGCHTYTVEYCTRCGDYDYDHEVAHEVEDIKYTVVQPYTQVGYGLVKAEMTCSQCGETFVYYAYTSCKHKDMRYDQATDTHTCTTCGYSYTGDVMPRVMLEYLSEDDDVLTFAYRALEFDFMGQWFGNYVWCVEEIEEDGRTYYSHVDRDEAFKIFAGWNLNDISYTGGNDHDYLAKNYDVMALIGYKEDGKLQYVEGVSAYGDITYAYDEQDELVPVQNIIEFEVGELNYKIDELEAESDVDYFIVVALVDYRNPEVITYVMD